MNTKSLALGAAIALASACGTAPDASSTGAAAPAEYHLLATVPVGGEGGWDYLSEDTITHRLYVSHSTAVYVIDMELNTVVGRIDSLPGVHGFAVAHDLNRGFASDGRANEVAIVDLSSLQVLSRVGTGENPDGIIYLPDVKEVWAFNGRGHSATVIGAETGDLLATIPLSGKPEFAVYDPAAGLVYNNIEDQNEIAVIDVAGHQVVATWPIAPGEAASGLAIDLAHHRLFAVCENQLMVMLNSATGEVVGTVPIGGGVDAARFDPITQLAFSSNGEGTVTIAHLDSPDSLTVVQTLETAPSARTMTLDPTTHRIYLSTADVEPPAAGADSTSPPGRRRMVPGSFKVLVYGRAE
ncbi:MAG: YncE family protein [Gemmatimonadota bacterium]|jgi:DNA-binding beta-propeller fold protein YncE